MHPLPTITSRSIGKYQKMEFLNFFGFSSTNESACWKPCWESADSIDNGAVSDDSVVSDVDGVEIASDHSVAVDGRFLPQVDITDD